MSSPVSTGVLKFGGGGAPSALGHAPPAWSRSGSAAPRFPTLCKRCASFRTKPASSQQEASQQPLGAQRGYHTGSHREGKPVGNYNSNDGGSWVKRKEQKSTDKENIHITKLKSQSPRDPGRKQAKGEGSQRGVAGATEKEGGAAGNEGRRRWREVLPDSEVAEGE